MKKEKILILDSNTRSGKAVIFSLKRAGYEIKVLNLDKNLNYSDLVLSFLKEESLKNIKYYMIIPCTDESLIPLSSRQDEVRAYAKFPFPSHDSILKSQDKLSLIKLAKEVNINVPISIDIYFSNDLNLNFIYEEIKSLNFPLILKPKKSVQDCNYGINFKPDRFIIRNNETLLEVLNNLKESNTQYLAQPYISGYGVGYFCLYRNGKSVLDFSHKRILEKPPEGGVSVLSVSQIPNPTILKKVHSLLDLLSWEGLSMVEFRANDRDELYLMEINPRFWGSLQLAINSGADFPLYLVDENLNNSNLKLKKTFDLWLKGLLDYMFIKLKRIALKNKVI